MKTKFDDRKGKLIVVDGIKWKWRTGKDNVVANSENGEKRLGTVAEVKGTVGNKFIKADDRFDRCRDWGRQGGMITPVCVEKWLRGAV